MEPAELAQNYYGVNESGSLAGPIFGLIVGLLAVFTILLIRNMNARLRRLPERFPERPDQEPAGSESDSDHRTG